MTTLDPIKALLDKLTIQSAKELGNGYVVYARGMAYVIDAVRAALSSLPAQAVDDRRQKYADRIAKIHGRDLDLCFGMGEFAADVTDEQKRAAMMAFFFPNTSPAPSQPAAVGVTDEMVQLVLREQLPPSKGDSTTVRQHFNDGVRRAAAVLEAALRSTP